MSWGWYLRGKGCPNMGLQRHSLYHSVPPPNIFLDNFLFFIKHNNGNEIPKQKKMQLHLTEVQCDEAVRFIGIVIRSMNKEVTYRHKNWSKVDAWLRSITQNVWGGLTELSCLCSLYIFQADLNMPEHCPGSVAIQLSRHSPFLSLRVRMGLIVKPTGFSLSRHMILFTS